MRGDTLASGGYKASWGPLDVSQEKWDEIFGDSEPLISESQRKRLRAQRTAKLLQPKRKRSKKPFAVPKKVLREAAQTLRDAGIPAPQY